jgi:DeoR family ulaG and ulaABCDEF operon transcriptional repressor
MQADVVLVAAERRLIERADEIIVLVDSSKFQASSGNVVCGLADIGTVITDSGISGEDVAMLKSAGVRAMIADER